MLFGHQNDDSRQPATPAGTMGMNVNPLAVDPATGVSLPAAPPTPPTPPSDLASPSVLNQPTAPSAPEFMTPPPAPVVQPGTAPIADIASPSSDITTMPDMSSAPESPADMPSMPEPPVMDEPTPVETPEPPTTDDMVNDTPRSDWDNDSPDPAGTTDLLDIKQQALSQLDPLVDKLDQTPEEKFRTTMMLIQSTDNPSRLPAAYKAAQAITDEKVRAQALLDVVNEINYFTHAKSAEQAENLER